MIKGSVLVVALAAVLGVLAPGTASADYYVGRYEYGGSSCSSPTDPMNWRMYYGPQYLESESEDAAWIADWVDWPVHDTGSGFGTTGYAYVRRPNTGFPCGPQQAYYNKLGVFAGHHTRLFSNRGPDAHGRSDSAGDAHVLALTLLGATDGRPAPAASIPKATFGPDKVAVTVAQALAHDRAVLVCENLTVEAQQIIANLLSKFAPTRQSAVRVGASLLDRCEAGLGADFADPGGDVGDWRLFARAHARRVVYGRDHRHATVCMDRSLAAVAAAVNVEGRWLLPELPTNALTDRQARTCGLR